MCHILVKIPLKTSDFTLAELDSGFKVCLSIVNLQSVGAFFTEQRLT